MILDLKNKTVSFPAGAILTLPQLRGLIAVFDPDVEPEPKVTLAPMDEGLAQLSESFLLAHKRNSPIVGPVVRDIFSVRSESRGYYYAVVHFEDDTWACSCWDWIHRKSDIDGHCKHIRRLYWI